MFDRDVVYEDENLNPKTLPNTQCGNHVTILSETLVTWLVPTLTMRLLFCLPFTTQEIMSCTAFNALVRTTVPSGRARRNRRALRASSANEGGDASAAADEEPVPPGCSRYAVIIKKPLGMYLETDKQGNIFVAELIPGGAAEASGLINVGDRLLATSAIVFNSSMDYGGVNVKKGEEQIRFSTRGESFDTVMAAISTWPAPRKMKLEFQRCDVVDETNA